MSVTNLRNCLQPQMSQMRYNKLPNEEYCTAKNLLCRSSNNNISQQMRPVLMVSCETNYPL